MIEKCNIDRVKVDWKLVQSWCVELKGQISWSTFETKIAICRGGIQVARKIVPNNEFMKISAQAYDDIKKLERIRVGQIPRKIKEPILVIDDVVETGDTALAVIAKIRKKTGASDIKIACLVKKSWSKVDPDFHVLETNQWIDFPWEIERDKWQKI